MNKNKNIMNLYKSIEMKGLKTKVVEVVSNHTGIKILSIKNNWFSNGQFPEDHQDFLIKTLQNAHVIQNEYINNIKVNL